MNKFLKKILLSTALIITPVVGTLGGAQPVYADNLLNESPSMLAPMFKTQTAQDISMAYLMSSYDKYNPELKTDSVLKFAMESPNVNLPKNASLKEQAFFIKDLMYISATYDTDYDINVWAAESFDKIETNPEKTLITKMRVSQNRLSGVQLQAVEIVAGNFAREARRTQKTDKDTAKYLYSYFKHIDYVNEGNGVFNLMKNKTGNCRDGAALFVMMAQEAGLPAHMVIGNHATRNSRPNGTIDKGNNHAWAAVKIDGRWQRVDVTGAMAYKNDIGFDLNHRKDFHENQIFGSLPEAFK